jgi:acylglycerol lipase
MSFLDGTHATADGVTLHTRRWHPMGQPKAAVVLTHGHGEHSGRYLHVGEALSASGYAVYTYDRRGHGLSGGRRGHLHRYEAALDDLQAMVNWARGETPGPWFLLGHSVGGQTSVYFLLRRLSDCAGVVAVSPWLRPTKPLRAWLRLILPLLARTLPRLALNSGLSNPLILSHDQAFLDTLLGRELKHTLITPRAARELFFVGERLLSEAPNFTTPLLVLHAGEDQLADPAASRLFFDRAGSADKTFHLYEGLYHEMLNETQRAAVLSEIVAWLDQRL